MWAKSSRENDAPHLAKPKTAKVDPRRAKPLSERDEPSWHASNTESMEPLRAMPHTENDEPTLPKLLIEREDPKC
jgi:hypothetical protein